MVHGKLNKILPYDENRLISVSPVNYPESESVLRAMFIDDLNEATKRSAGLPYRSVEIDGFKDAIGTYYFRVHECTNNQTSHGVTENCPPPVWYRYDPNSALYRFNWRNIGIIVGSVAVIGTVIYRIQK